MVLESTCRVCARAKASSRKDHPAARTNASPATAHRFANCMARSPRLTRSGSGALVEGRFIILQSLGFPYGAGRSIHRLATEPAQPERAENHPRAWAFGRADSREANCCCILL